MKHRLHKHNNKGQVGKVEEDRVMRVGCMQVNACVLNVPTLRGLILNKEKKNKNKSTNNKNNH